MRTWPPNRKPGPPTRLIQLTDNPGIKDTLRFLREREVVHFQRFGETLNDVQAYLEVKKFY